MARKGPNAAYLESIRSTTAQMSYLQALAEQCFAKGITIGFDMRNARFLKSEASAEIYRLKALLAKHK